MTKRLLVSGGSGFLGWNVCVTALSQGWRVTAVRHNNPVLIQGVDEYECDLREQDSVAQMISAVRPDAVIHAAALANPNSCETQPQDSYAANVTATCNLSKLCADAGIPMVFTSTDLVFDGEHAPYAEDSATAPLMVYGRHKVEAENAVLAAGGIVCRMPLMFGRRDSVPAGFIGPWFDKLAAGESLTLFVDEYRTPVSGGVAARGLLLGLAELSGGAVLHLGGPQRISRYDFGLLFCKVFGFDAALIEPVPMNSIRMAAPRARDVALDSSRAFALGYPEVSLEAQLDSLQ